MTEALANVIAHGGAGTGSIPISLRLDVRRSESGGEASVTVSDAGTAFDPLTVPPKARPRTLAEAEPGGHGLTLLRQFADALDYSYSEGQNHLTIHVRWNEDGGSLMSEEVFARTRFARGPDRRIGRSSRTPRPGADLRPTGATRRTTGAAAISAG